MRGLNGGDEELAAVGVGAGIGHGQQERLVVLEGECLVGELGSVDALAAATVASGEVTTLEHKVGDHAVEGAVLVAQGLAHLAHALLPCAKSAKVLCGLGNHVVAEHKLDASGSSATDRDVEEHLRTGVRKAVVVCHSVEV